MLTALCRKSPLPLTKKTTVARIRTTRRNGPSRTKLSPLFRRKDYSHLEAEAAAIVDEILGIQYTPLKIEAMAIVQEILGSRVSHP
jgi:hypothetical protein